MLISPDYLQINRDLHATRRTYGAGGHRWARKVAELATGSVLDYGCGKGTLKQALPHLDIREYDPAIEGKDEEPEPAELVVCTDVLEHIEPEYLDDVLADISACTLGKALLVAATRPANKTLPDGRNAHLIIEPPEWWRAQIEKHFVIEGEEADSTQPGEICYIVRRL